MKYYTVLQLAKARKINRTNALGLCKRHGLGRMIKNIIVAKKIVLTEKEFNFLKKLPKHKIGA